MARSLDYRSRFDLVITGLSLPTSSGENVAGILRRGARLMAIAMISAMHPRLPETPGGRGIRLNVTP
jgi:hypothetical protein